MAGTITKRMGRRGFAYTAVIDGLPDPVTGKRHQKRISAPTRKECELRVAELLQQTAKGIGVVDEKKTIGEFIADWLPTLDSKLKPATARRYKDLMRLHVVPFIGNVQVAKLSPIQVEQMYTDRLKAGLSPTTVHQIHNVLHKALDQALRWNYTLRNVTELVDSPQPVNPEIAYWTHEEVAAVFTAARGEEIEAFIWMGVLTGMRRGEMLGLKWGDISFDRAVLSVARTLSRGESGVWITGEPKTASGRRQIELSDELLAVLRQHKARQNERRLALGPVWTENDWVFTNQTGGPLHVNTLVKQYKRIIQKAGVRDIRIHGMRHTCPTLMLQNGENPKLVAERLGHSDVGITLKTYSHVTKGTHKEASNRLEESIKRSIETAS